MSESHKRAQGTRKGQAQPSNYQRAAAGDFGRRAAAGDDRGGSQAALGAVCAPNNAAGFRRWSGLLVEESRGVLKILPPFINRLGTF